MIDPENALRRALAGEHVPELPASVRAVVERLRERLWQELPARAADVFVKHGQEAFAAMWRDAIDDMFDRSEAAVAEIAADEARAPQA
jgi:hypothetical protein